MGSWLDAMRAACLCIRCQRHSERPGQQHAATRGKVWQARNSWKSRAPACGQSVTPWSGHQAQMASRHVHDTGPKQTESPLGCRCVADRTTGSGRHMVSLLIRGDKLECGASGRLQINRTGQDCTPVHTGRVTIATPAPRGTGLRINLHEQVPQRLRWIRTSTASLPSIALDRLAFKHWAPRPSSCGRNGVGWTAISGGGFGTRWVLMNEVGLLTWMQEVTSWLTSSARARLGPTPAPWI